MNAAGLKIDYFELNKKQITDLGGAQFLKN